MNYRWYLFWIRGFFSGGEIRKAYKDIEKAYYNGNENTEKQIHNLLEHAKTTTKFYSQNISGNINDFPVVNKQILKDNYSDVISKEYKDKKLHTMSTSGSTGTPFTIRQDKRKRKRVIAEVLFFGKICGYTFGEKQLFLRAWLGEQKTKSKLSKFLQNMIAMDISKINTEKLEEFEKIFKKHKRIKNILSYANAIDTISQHLIKKSYNPKDFNIQSVITTSEVLQEVTRDRLVELFGCTVVSRYSNMENGILGQECSTNKEIHLNTANYYFEFLKLDEDKPAEYGELARIVITDLYNYAMPMIRYDTGDLAIVGESKCKIESKVLKELYGRRLDVIYNTIGDTISPHMISITTKKYKNIKQYKFIQCAKKEYKIILNIENKFNEEDKMIHEFSEILGQDAKIAVEYVDEIPVLSSGKRKYIENLYKKNRAEEKSQ